MTAVSITKRLPAGIPTKIFDTGANQTASIAMAFFGQAGTAKIDAKILEAGYAIPQDRFDASNFVKTAFSTTLPTTSPYFEAIENSKTYKFFFYNNSFYAFNETTKTLSQLTTSGACYRQSAITNNTLLSSYAGNFDSGTGVKIYNTGSGYFENTGVAKITHSSDWPQRYGYGAGIAGGVYFSIDWQGYVSYKAVSSMNASGTGGTWTNSTSSTPYNVFASYASPGYYSKAWSVNDIGYALAVNTSSGVLYLATCSGPSYWSYAGQVSLANYADTISGTAYNANSVSAEGIYEYGGCSFVLVYMASGYYRVVIINHANSNTMSVVGGSTYANGQEFQGTPAIPTSGGLVFTKRDGSLVKITTSGTVTPFTSALVTTPFSSLVNYSAYSQYKNQKVTPPGNIAFASGDPNTNGTSFFGYDGVYTLTRDESLTKLDAVGTNDQWFEKQVSAATSARVEYTGVTLDPNKEIWVTSNVETFVTISGFKD